jgi:stage II sporulation protein AB (anti-sigma F factor)
MIVNQMEITFKALSVNEGFARACVAAFCVQANPTLDELTDIKTAVSEAVTNCVVHAYPKTTGDITISVFLHDDGKVVIKVADTGIGIKDFAKAREPFFTSKPEQERSGMGFTVIESFMDSMMLEHNTPSGLVVTMEKKFVSESKVALGG